MKKVEGPRPYKIEYWFGAHRTKADSRGYPKTMTGEWGKSAGAAGAIKAINQGIARKVRCTNRTTNQVEWTAIAEKRIAGITPARIIKGDHV